MNSSMIDEAEATALKTEIVMLRTNTGIVCNGYVEMGYQYPGCNLASTGQSIKLLGDNMQELLPQMYTQFMSFMNDQTILQELYDASKASKADPDEIT